MTENAALSLQSTISRTQDILFEKVGSEVVMLDLEKGNYHAMDEIAGEIWEMIAEPIRVDALVDQLLVEFDVAREDCERDVLAYLNQLAEWDLLVVGV